ncbi:MAG TPA: CvpA family protein [Planctomycetaceae bacterium]|nr:CvpA family protein [Planctomycetaceae bacterium]
MDALFGLLLALVLGVVTWCVASEGAWGATLTFLCVLFAGLLTMNFFEPLAAMIEDSGGSFLAPFADLIAFMGTFGVLTFLARMATEQISPVDIELDARLYQATRWVFAVATGYISMAIVLTAVHTSPLPREFIGFSPEKRNFFDISAPDRQWLGFTQHVSEHVLSAGRIFDGPVWDVPGAEQKVWPSFAIRYATRREGLATGTVRKPAAAGIPGGGGGSGGGPAPGPPPAF